MSLQLEAGKFYRTRDGRKVGPITETRSMYGYRWSVTGVDALWNDRGIDGNAPSGLQPSDIIAEWSDAPAETGPVRTVTRREIVPGDYGHVWVGEGMVQEALIKIERSFMTAAELRAAIAILAEIADALEDQQ